MINAWSLAWEALNGTMDKEYPIKNESYDDFENPNPPQNIDLNVGAGNTAHDTDWIANSGGYEWTPGSPWPPSVPDNDDETIDLMAARDIAPQFCQANILKYGSRYGSKDGRNKTDLLKVIHYAMLLLHFDGHYGEPSMPSGNFEQMP